MIRTDNKYVSDCIIAACNYIKSNIRISMLPQWHTGRFKKKIAANLAFTTYLLNTFHHAGEAV